MADHIMHLKSFQALRERKSLEPLSDEEYERMRGLIPGCGFVGQPFDETNMLYPFEIPRKSVVTVLSEKDQVFGVGVRYNRQKFVKVIGGLDLVQAYESHSGDFLFAVGFISEKEKNGRVFYNMRPRGWIIVTQKPIKKVKNEKS